MSAPPSPCRRPVHHASLPESLTPLVTPTPSILQNTAEIQGTKTTGSRLSFGASKRHISCLPPLTRLGFRASGASGPTGLRAGDVTPPEFPTNAAADFLLDNTMGELGDLSAFCHVLRRAKVQGVPYAPLSQLKGNGVVKGVFNSTLAEAVAFRPMSQRPSVPAAQPTSPCKQT